MFTPEKPDTINSYVNSGKSSFTKGVKSQQPNIEDESAQTEALLRSALDENQPSIPEAQVADDNVMAEEAGNMGPSNFQFFPQCLTQIKRVVTAFFSKMRLPFCSKKQIEEELSRSITLALIEASEQSIHQSQLIDTSQLSEHQEGTLP